jgi:drug/metabolite transporter (DMT)-like permease
MGGGALLLLAGAIAGDWSRFDAGIVTPKAMVSVAYLIVFGSLIGFSAYIWLLGVTTPAKAATYAYVNPIVAVLIGRAFGDEPLTPRTLLAAGVIVAAVVLITRARQRGQEP